MRHAMFQSMYIIILHASSIPLVVSGDLVIALI
jgi:hypothetical protein